jgi:hypothetical protein
MIAFSILLLGGAIFTGCKKESAGTATSNQTSDLQVGNNSSCKLTHLVWAYYFTWDFHYNDKGLADEWRIDFGNGFIQDFKLEYDKFDKLITANAYDDFNNLVFTSSFTYHDNLIATQKYADLQTGAAGDVYFTHNNKGQIVREDDPVNDSHQLLSYDKMGNCVRSDYYTGDYLWFSDRYTYENKVRNPLLTVTGVDFMFPYLGVGYFNKLWFSNNLSIFYDVDGTGYVLNDYDVPQTVFTTGEQNFPLMVNYFDKVSQSPLEIAFGYSCNGHNNLKGKSSQQANNFAGGNRTMLHPMLASVKSVKEQINELKKQVSHNQLRKYQN